MEAVRNVLGLVGIWNQITCSVAITRREIIRMVELGLVWSRSAEPPCGIWMCFPAQFIIAQQSHGIVVLGNHPTQSVVSYYI